MSDSTINSRLFTTMTVGTYWQEPRNPHWWYDTSSTAQSIHTFLTTLFKAHHNQVPTMFPPRLLLFPKLLDAVCVVHSQTHLRLSPGKALITSTCTTTTNSWEGRQCRTSALPYPNPIFQWCFTSQNYLFLLLSLFFPSTIKAAILTELGLR